MLDQLKRKQFNKKFKDEENPRNNFILSEHLAICNDTNIKCRNHNVLAIEMEGGMNGLNIMRENILQMNQNYIIFDYCRDLYDSTKTQLINAGYLIKIIDFNRPERSDLCNVFEYIHTAEDIEDFISIILEDILHNANYNSDVMQLKDIMISILKIVSYYLGYECLMKQCNILTIIDLLKQIHPDNIIGRRRMEFKFEMVCDEDVKALILKEWNFIKDNHSYEEQKQAFANLVIYSHFIMNCKEFRMLADKNNLHLNEMKSRKVAIFIEIGIGQASIFKKYIEVLFHFMLKELLSEEKIQTYPVQISFLDETLLGDYIGNLSEKFMNITQYNVRYFCDIRDYYHLKFLFSNSKDVDHVFTTESIDENILNLFDIVILNKNSYVNEILTGAASSSDLKEYEKIISNLTSKKDVKKEIKQLRKISKDQCAVLVRGEHMVVDDIVK